MPIISFKNSATKDIAEQVISKASLRLLPKELHRIAFYKFCILEAAESLEELFSVPGLRLEALRGDRKGQYSIRINSKYRICFKWDKAKISAVEIIDYH